MIPEALGWADEKEFWNTNSIAHATGSLQEGALNSSVGIVPCYYYKHVNAKLSLH